MEERRAAAIDLWLAGLPLETVERYFLLLDELCRGLDVSKHEQFGFLRLRAEFETSGEIFGCSLEDLRDAALRRLPDSVRGSPRGRSPLEVLRDKVRTQGHPDLR